MQPTVATNQTIGAVSELGMTGGRELQSCRCTQQQGQQLVDPYQLELPWGLLETNDSVHGTACQPLHCTQGSLAEHVTVKGWCGMEWNLLHQMFIISGVLSWSLKYCNTRPTHAGASASTVELQPRSKISLTSGGHVVLIPDIKLIRTDTTLWS